MPLIRVSKFVYDKLLAEKRGNDTFDNVIARLFVARNGRPGTLTQPAQPKGGEDETSRPVG